MSTKFIKFEEDKLFPRQTVRLPSGVHTLNIVYLMRYHKDNTAYYKDYPMRIEAAHVVLTDIFSRSEFIPNYITNWNAQYYCRDLNNDIIIPRFESSMLDAFKLHNRINGETYMKNLSNFFWYDPKLKKVCFELNFIPHNLPLNVHS